MAVTGQREGCGSHAAAQVMMKPVSHGDIMQSVLLPSTWVVSSDSAFLGSHADVPCIPETMLRLTVHAATEGRDWVSGSDTAKGLVNVCGPCYH